MEHTSPFRGPDFALPPVHEARLAPPEPTPPELFAAHVERVATTGDALDQWYIFKLSTAGKVAAATIGLGGLAFQEQNVAGSVGAGAAVTLLAASCCVYSIGRNSRIKEGARRAAAQDRYDEKSQTENDTRYHLYAVSKTTAGRRNVAMHYHGAVTNPDRVTPEMHLREAMELASQNGIKEVLLGDQALAQLSTKEPPPGTAASMDIWLKQRKHLLVEGASQIVYSATPEQWLAFALGYHRARPLDAAHAGLQAVMHELGLKPPTEPAELIAPRLEDSLSSEIPSTAESLKPCLPYGVQEELALKLPRPEGMQEISYKGNIKRIAVASLAGLIMGAVVSIGATTAADNRYEHVEQQTAE